MMPTTDDPMSSVREAPAKQEKLAQGSSKEIAIRIEKVTVEFPHGNSTRVILNKVDLEIPVGQFVVVVGKSGGGKTTLLNLLSGLVQPSEGPVSVLGTTPHLARLRTGFMFARDALLPWRSAQRNVEYGLELRGISRDERRQRAMRWLERVHLKDAAQLWPWQLSQGMRQRVALARTWALEPELLLMDEPFAALDAQTRISIQDEFLQLWQSTANKTVVFVTHDLAEAIALADRVILVANAQIIRDVHIPFSRPRSMSSLAVDPEFHRLLEDLRDELRH